MTGRLSAYSWLILFALLASGLYLVKYEVQGLKDRNDALLAELEAERLAHDLLQAEWAYLNRPSRLQELADKHLKLVPMQPGQMAHWSDIPQPEQTVAAHLTGEAE